jgi:hypothetical protein
MRRLLTLLSITAAALVLGVGAYAAVVRGADAAPAGDAAPSTVASVTDDNGGRLDRDERTEPGDDRDQRDDDSDDDDSRDSDD